MSLLFQYGGRAEGCKLKAESGVLVSFPESLEPVIGAKCFTDGVRGRLRESGLSALVVVVKRQQKRPEIRQVFRMIAFR